MSRKKIIVSWYDIEHYWTSSEDISFLLPSSNLPPPPPCRPQKVKQIFHSRLAWPSLAGVWLQPLFVHLQSWEKRDWRGHSGTTHRTHTRLSSTWQQLSNSLQRFCTNKFQGFVFKFQYWNYPSLVYFICVKSCTDRFYVWLRLVCDWYQTLYQILHQLSDNQKISTELFLHITQGWHQLCQRKTEFHVWSVTGMKNKTNGPPCLQQNVIFSPNTLHR